MRDIVFENNRINPDDGETVLDALTRHGHAIPSGCRSGVCQACLMELESGVVPGKARTALSDAQVALNYFLSCQCVPQQPIAVRRIAAANLRQEATVAEKFNLSDQVVCLRLKADLAYLPGQYVTLWKDENVGRSYSLASLPDEEDFLEFHIKVIEGGQFSAWAKRELNPGDSLQLQGPMGQCIFTAKPDQPLLLCGIGTGLAPIYGILRQALAQGHNSPIHLVLGALDPRGFYLIDALQELAEQHANLTLHCVVLNEAAAWMQQGDIFSYCKQAFAELGNWRVFLCGDDGFVLKMRKQCFLAGAAMTDISADSFLAFSNGHS